MSGEKPIDFWQYKPWWCQPWSIVVTGVILVSSSWLVIHRWWLTVGVFLFVLIWWAYFLVIVPQLVAASNKLNLEAGNRELQKGNKHQEHEI